MLPFNCLLSSFSRRFTISSPEMRLETRAGSSVKLKSHKKLLALATVTYLASWMPRRMPSSMLDPIAVDEIMTASNKQQDAFPSSETARKSEDNHAGPENPLDKAKSAAARVIQRHYRGYRDRRQLRGLGLDASARWLDV